MSIRIIQHDDGWTSVVAGSIPTEDIIVRSRVGYVPQYATDVYGSTERVTKDITLANLLRKMSREFPKHELVSIGTPVNFDIAPTHLTRVEMKLQDEAQVENCLKEISVSDMMIRLRIQPAWDWQGIYRDALEVILHVGWYDTVYFMQFKDVFFGDLHCRYSAKFGLDPRQAKMTHYRYTPTGDLEELVSLNSAELHANAIKSEVEFLRVFRDGTRERT